MYLLKLFHDNLPPNSEVMLQAQHSMIYVWKGSATINDNAVAADSAVYAADVVAVKAGAKGAVLWRWELVPKTDPLHLLNGKGVSSLLRVSRKVKMFELVPTSKWLLRLDTIIEHEGTTGLHSHPGSGIRCLLSGEMLIESEKGEGSINKNPGDVWYEEGAYPLVSSAPAGVKSSFLRGMILPPDFFVYPETAIWIERKTPARYKEWKPYVQKIVTLR